MASDSGYAVSYIGGRVKYDVMHCFIFHIYVTKMFMSRETDIVAKCSNMPCCIISHKGLIVQD